MIAGGDDIDIWTIDELKENIEKFASLQSPMPSAQPTISVSSH